MAPAPNPEVRAAILQLLREAAARQVSERRLGQLAGGSSGTAFYMRTANDCKLSTFVRMSRELGLAPSEVMRAAEERA